MHVRTGELALLDVQPTVRPARWIATGRTFWTTSTDATTGGTHWRDGVSTCRSCAMVAMMDGGGCDVRAGLLLWQHIFAGFHEIRQHSPQCRILSLTESCYSGGCIKFMDNRALRYYRELETWSVR